MKLWTLLENTACREDLRPEHGLSLYLETGSRRILFDAGKSDAFARNAEKMGVDLSKVDTVVLSHGHYDHGGGLPRFLEINHSAPIYASPHALGDFYHGPEKYIGLPESVKHSRRLILTDSVTDLGDGLTLYPGRDLPQTFPQVPHTLGYLQNGQLCRDEFPHEQYLMIREGQKDILISGCSHRGIVNIAESFHPDILIGGFHFKSVELDSRGQEYLTEAAHRLLKQKTMYYTGHCTGLPQYDFLKSIMGKRLSAFSTGIFLDL